VDILRRGKNWWVTSGGLTAEVCPQLGGKIRRLVSRVSGRNFFFEDPRRRPTGDGYLGHDISGQDECFPTVGKSRGRFEIDHGVLWDTAWSARADGDRLVTWISRPQGMPVEAVRTISAPGPNRLRLDYTFVNLGRRPLPFIYSSHPILVPAPESKVFLPGVRQLQVFGQNGKLRAGAMQPWPEARLAGGGNTRLDTGFTPDRALCGKWFAAGTGEAAVTFPDTGERLDLTWDRETLPVLGVRLSLGVVLAASRPRPEQWMCVALEPCTVAHDVRHQAQPQAWLEPDRPFSFWLEWGVKRQGIEQ